MDEITPDEVANEHRLAVATLTAVQAWRDGHLPEAELLPLLDSLIWEAWPGDPARYARLVTPLAYVALRCVSVLAEDRGTTVAALLADLGAEAAGPPPEV